MISNLLFQRIDLPCFHDIPVGPLRMLPRKMRESVMSVERQNEVVARAQRDDLAYITVPGVQGTTCRVTNKHETFYQGTIQYRTAYPASFYFVLS